MVKAKYFFLNSFAIIAILGMAVYWFVPLTDNRFNFAPVNSNFSLSNTDNSTLQFYSNMRFPTNEISYKIYDCSLKRKADMEGAFKIIEEKTLLEFYPVEYGEEISVRCSDVFEFDKDLFIAGEGGPTNVTIAGNFNVIHYGKILLLKDSDCSNPNIAIHELLHVLGFTHSSNPNNIMYEISYCNQEISNDITKYINRIYSTPSYPDLIFEEIDAEMHGKYFEINITVRNNGLSSSGESLIVIYADEKRIKEVEIPSLEIGYGRKISLSTWVPQLTVNNVQFVIENNFSELNKTNNQVVLEIKK